MTTLLFFFKINQNRICLERCELSKLLLRWLHLFITLVILHWILYFLRKRKVIGIIKLLQRYASNGHIETSKLIQKNWWIWYERLSCAGLNLVNLTPFSPFSVSDLCSVYTSYQNKPASTKVYELCLSLFCIPQPDEKNRFSLLLCKFSFSQKIWKNWRNFCYFFDKSVYFKCF